MEVENENTVCNDCHDKMFYHLTDEAVRVYLGTLVSYLDDFDATCGVLPDEEWRALLGMERSGV